MERAHGEEELLKNNELMQDILDNVPSIIVVRDLEGRRLLVNRQFEKVTGVRKEEAIGSTPQDLYSASEAAKILETDRRVLDSGKPLTMEGNGTIDNERHTFIGTKVPLYNSDGVPYAICSLAIDITPRKQAEDALRKHQDNLEEQVSSAQLSCGHHSRRKKTCWPRSKH